jgi:hypothetical protein
MADSPRQEFDDDLRLRELVPEQLAVLQAANWHLPRSARSDSTDGQSIAVAANQ